MDSLPRAYKNKMQQFSNNDNKYLVLLFYKAYIKFIIDYDNFFYGSATNTTSTTGSGSELYTKIVFGSNEIITRGRTPH